MRKIAHSLRRLLLIFPAVTTVGLLIVGCAPRTYVPGPGQSALNLERTKGHCQLVAQDSGTSSFAFGSLGFVVGSEIGHAIGDAVRADNTFDACMREAGFIEVPPQTAVASPTALAPPTSIATQTVGETGIIGELQTREIGLTTITGLSLAAVKEQRQVCIDGVRAEPRYEAIVPHLPQITTGKFSILQLADDTIPKRQEAQEFGAYIDEVRPCVEKSFQVFARIIPGAGPILTEGINESDAITVEFVHRQLTWGQLANQLQQIDLAATAKIERLMSQ